MNKMLNWERGFFSRTHKIYSESTLIGTLKENTWSQSAKGEINGKEYNFKTSGVFKPKTQITNTQNSSIIGEITYSSFMNKATIKIHNKIFNWKYDNIWNTKWKIQDSYGMQMYLKGSSTKGKIESNIYDDVLILAGLYITNYYRQFIGVLFIVFIPVWITVLN